MHEIQQHSPLLTALDVYMASPQISSHILTTLMSW